MIHRRALLHGLLHRRTVPGNSAPAQPNYKTWTAGPVPHPSGFFTV